MDNDSVLTTQEVADMLKIAKNTVYELIKRGELNAYKVGKKVRIDLKDVVEYKNRTMAQYTGASVTQPAIPVNSAIKTVAKQEKMQGFVICGQDVILDVLMRYLQLHPDGVQALRSYEGSYQGLYLLYHGKVHLSTAHLWDAETGEYNIPYVKKMLPGTPAVIIRLASRLQGFYVRKGNPKEIHGWEDLKRKDITIINREKGSGTRVLMDEHLKRMGVDVAGIDGYHRESTSHLAIASTVARGGADLGLGNEKSALQVRDVDFIPLQTEQLDLVFRREDYFSPEIQMVIEILNSSEFKTEIAGLGGYCLDDLGRIVAEI